MKPIIVKKEEQIKIVSEYLKTAKSFIVFEYQGLDAGTFSELRKKLSKSGSKVHVFKNNILSRAIKLAKVEGLDHLLIGPNAIAFAFEDEMNVFKSISDLKKQFDFIKIKGGYISGGFADAMQIQQLANIPNREGLYGMLLSCLTSPIRSFLYAAQAVAEKK